MMKKVLIITNAFNQTTKIGTQRLRGLARYLTEFGWESIILTIKSTLKPDPHLNIVETSYENLLAVWKKRFNFNPNESIKKQMGDPILKNKKTFIDYVTYIFDEIFSYPDEYKDWYKSAVEQGKDIFEKNKIVAIISSSYPPTTHLIASKFKDTYNVPWLADFRDLWTQNHYYEHTSIRRLIEKKLEINILSKADALTTTTPYLANNLKKLHKKRTYSIPNGFSYEENDTNKVILYNKFNISYTGILYEGKRDPLQLFKALNELISDGIINESDVEIRLFSQIEDWLEKEIKTFKLEKIAKLYGLVDRKTVSKKQRESQILLIITNSKEEEICPAKLYEYLAAKRPILTIGGTKGFVKEILDETKAGTFAISKDEIKNYLKNSYKDWKKNGKVSYFGRESEINKYSHREMVKKFSKVLYDITT